MTNWGVLSWLVKQTRLSWTDTQSSPYRGVQPCAAVTLQYTRGSLANIKPPSSSNPSYAAVLPPSSRLHVWNGDITACRLSEKKRRPHFFFFFFQARQFLPAAQLWNLKSMHGFFLLFFPNLFFLYEASSQPVLPRSTPTFLSPWSFPPPTFLLLIPPQNLCLAGVVRLGGNGFSGYRDRRKWESFTPRPVLD